MLENGEEFNSDRDRPYFEIYESLAEFRWLDEQLERPYGS